MDQIFPIAPSPVILIKDFNNKVNWSKIESKVSALTWESGENFNVSSTKEFFTDDLSSIKDEIIHECKMFIKNVCPLNFNFDLKLTNSWVNKMVAGDTHPWHTHPFSVVSGVIFLDDCKENLKLAFKSSIKNSIPPYSVMELDYYTSLDDVAEQNNNLHHHMVLFFSNVLHSVPPISNFSGTRRTISFNTFWQGNVDFGDSLNSYNFK